MALFTLDTDAVSSTKTSIDNLSNQMNQVMNEVIGYDTSCDEFDFTTAKNVIASNLEACTIKIQNTSSYIESVVTSHSNLQNNLKFESSEEKAAREALEKQTTSSRVSSSAISYTSSGYTGGSYLSASSVSIAPSTINSLKEDTVSSEVIDTKISSIHRTILDINNLTDDLSQLKDAITYNKAGYALFGGMMLIGCASTIGNIGDIVEFTLKDGSKLRCLIIDQLEDNSPEIRFFVNEEWTETEDDSMNQFTENIEKIENLGSYEQSTSVVDLTNLPAIGEHTSKWSTLGEEWTVATTNISVPDYEKVIQSNHISQNSDQKKYGGYCLAFSYVHASNLYNGYTADTAVDASNYKHASEFSSFYSDSKSDTLNKIYSEIVQGRPVVMQVNGNKEGTSRHFVTVVGFRNSITDPKQLTEKDLLIIDSWDGNVERMDQDNSRFMTTGKETGKKYSGYYLRVLNPKKETKNRNV